jgi:hypothetical protein
MMKKKTGKQTHSLRVYHFGATVLAIGIALIATYWVLEIQKTTQNNFRETRCNQSLLVLATQDVWSEGLDKCSPEIRKALKEKYRR